MRIHWPRLARLRLPGSVCLSVHLFVCLQLSALLYGGRSTCIPMCESAFGRNCTQAPWIRQSPDSRPIPSVHLSACTMLVYLSALCLLLMHTGAEGNGRQGGKGSR